MFKRIECPELMFPLWVFVKGETEEINVNELSNGIHYVLAKNGAYTVCKNELYTTINKATSFGGVKLAEFAEATELTVPKIDRATYDFMVKLFMSVYKKYQSEVNVLLYYQSSTDKWFVRLPKQDVSGAHVTYELTDEDVWYCDGAVVDCPDDAECFGTCHSHASMGAFFSGTDDADDKTNIGYQIVIGKVNTSAVETKCRLAINGKNVDKKLEEVVSDITETFPEIEVPAIVSKKVVTTTSYGVTNAYNTWEQQYNDGYSYTGCRQTTTKKKGEAEKDVQVKSSELDVSFTMKDGTTITTKCPITFVNVVEKGGK